ncbi:MAG: M1 family metallopeptidase [Actinomycetota bacterium]|nr:M1 family metallopeptidase [Actinomycetota bacterium]
MAHSTDPAPDAPDLPAYRLPRTVLPRHYRLELTPDLASATFSGQVAIDVEVVAPTSSVVLNAAELDITSATVRAGGTVLAATVTLDPEEERATLGLPAELTGGPATVELAFGGILNDKLHGFYRSTFTDEDGAERVIATTQMEATDARRAFPCFDEPDLKATFEVSLVVDEGLAAYSNGAVVAEEPVPGTGRRRVRFATTMVMSTYLVAFVVGPLEATAPADVAGVPLRVVHTPGKAHLTSFALEVGAHALRFFTDYFGIPYPADKLDLVAIPDFAFGAMENLGCVTFRESVLLVDPDQAARVELERVADVVCHEIAHMWFGDLVTMGWWNGIWLNEAFATFMEVAAVDAFRPEWQRWVAFGTEREAALAVDGLHATRPVEYPVGRPEEAQGMFDVLTYQKGGSVLRMLERFVGAEVFRDGIRRYLRAHAHANTETADLWRALEEASGLPVGSIMDSWILQGGYPLVVVDGDTVRQEPFSYRAEPGGAIGDAWRVPLLVRTAEGRAGHGGHTATTAVLLDPARGGGASDAPTGGTAALPGAAALPSGGTLPSGAGAGTLVVNAGGHGFYRVAYPLGHLDQLAGGFADLLPLERYCLISDAWAAALAGRGSLDGFTRVTRAVVETGEGDPSVWSVVLGALGLFDRVVPDDQRPALAGAVRAVIGPMAARLGWDPGDDDTERTPALRAAILRMLGTVGADPDVRAEAARRFAAGARDGGGGLDPDIASAVLDVVADTGGPAEFDTYLDRYRSPANPQEENRYLYGLAAFDQADLARRAFELAVTEVRTQNAPFVVQLLLANRANGPATWARVVSAWDDLVERFPANILPRMLEGVRGLVDPDGLAGEVTDFVRTHPLPAGGRTVDQILERLAVNVAFKDRWGRSVVASLAAAHSALAD